jgi:hypothetical protein
LDGTVETVQLDFLLRRADTRAPYSTLSPAVDEIVQGAASKIYGTAHDHAPGSGVASVALSIRCANDATYWDGAGWTADETWLLAAGTTAWTYDAGGIPWESGHAYTIKVRATDNAGNVEMPVTHSTTPAAPNLISPPDGTTTDDATPAFDWSDVPDARYMIELDNDSDFSSPEVHEIPLLSTSAYQPAASLPAGTYHWHVKAVDGAYVAGDWSEAWTVTITPAQRIYLPRILRGSQEVRTESPSPSQRPRQ